MSISKYCATDYKAKWVGSLYTLRNPDDGDIFYVGKTQERNGRLGGHIHEVVSLSNKNKNEKKCAYIRKLLSEGKKPIMGLIAEHQIRTHYDELYYGGFLYSIKKGKCIIPSHKKYLQFNITIEGKQLSLLAHRLVAMKCIPNPNNLPEVNHLDGNKWNNWSWNLAWCTRPQNIQHGFNTGLIMPTWLGKFGANHHRSKAVMQTDKKGLIINEFGSAREAARLTSINYGTISNVLIKKGKTAGGFIWKYKQ